MTRTRIIGSVLVVVVLAAIVWVARPGVSGTPLDPRGTDQVGTAAIIETVRELGTPVDITGRVPDDATTIVVLADRLDEQVRDDIRAHVRAGGRLVLLDPGSPLNPLEPQDGFVVPTAATLDASCPLLDNVAPTVHSDRWLPLAAPPEAVAQCYPVDGQHGLVIVPVGDGEIAVTGAADALVNREIATNDHAQLAVALLAPEPGQPVAVVWDATVGAGDVALFDLLPDGVVRGFWILVVAAVVGAIAVGRRHGPPVPERLPVRVPASELVLAIGELLGRGGHRDAAAARLRADLRDEVAHLLHVGPDTDAEVLVELVTRRIATVDQDEVRTALLDAPVPNDAALLAVTVAIGTVRQATLTDGAAQPS